MTEPRASGQPGGTYARLAEALIGQAAPRLPGDPAPPPLGPTALQLQTGHEQLISWNPTQVRFWRFTRARKGSGFDQWKEDPVGGMGPYVCRIHQQARGSANVSEPTTGNQERDTTWGMIMPAHVPLRVTDGEDGNVRVECWHNVHGRFRLRRLRALEAQNRVFGWQSDLERIAGSGPFPPPSPGQPLPPDYGPPVVVPPNPVSEDLLHPVR